MKKQFNKIGNQPLTKTLKQILIIVIVLIVLYFIIKKVVKALTPEEEDRTRKNINNELKKEIDASQLSYSESQYETMAASLAEAMRGHGTDEETIYRILNKMNNIHDWNKLQYVYNSTPRDIASYTWNELTPDLISAFGEELDPMELAQVNQILTTRTGYGI